MKHSVRVVRSQKACLLSFHLCWRWKHRRKNIQKTEALDNSFETAQHHFVDALVKNKLRRQNGTENICYFSWKLGRPVRVSIDQTVQLWSWCIDWRAFVIVLFCVTHGHWAKRTYQPIVAAASVASATRLVGDGVHCTFAGRIAIHTHSCTYIVDIYVDFCSCSRTYDIWPWLTAVAAVARKQTGTRQASNGNDTAAQNQRTTHKQTNTEPHKCAHGTLLQFRTVMEKRVSFDFVDYIIPSTLCTVLVRVQESGHQRCVSVISTPQRERETDATGGTRLELIIQKEYSHAS